MHLSAMDRYCPTELENRDKQSSKYDDVERMMAELFGLCDSDKIANSETISTEKKTEEKRPRREINQESSSSETEDFWQVLERDYKRNNNILLVRSISKEKTSCVNSNKLLPGEAHTSKKMDEVQQNLLKNENIRMQRDSLSEETNYKTTTKRIHSKSPERVLTKKMQKMQKVRRASSVMSPAENLTNDRIFECEGSEDKQIHNNNNNNNSEMWKNITEYTEKEEEMYNSLKQRRKLKRRQDKINRIREKNRCLFQDCIISPTKSESDEDRKIIAECLTKRRLEFASNNSELNDALNDVTTEEETEDIYEMIKIQKRKRDVSANNNLQDGTEKTESVNSSDSTICIENDRLHDFTDGEETDCNSDKTSTCKRNVSVDTSQKDIEIPMKIQRTENSSVIVNITAVINQSDAGRSKVVNITQRAEHDSQENQDNVENVNLADTDKKISTDIKLNLLATKEVNMQATQENVTSADKDVNISKDIRPNLTLATKEVNAQENQDKNGNINLAEEDLKDIRPDLSSILMQEKISSIKGNDGCDVSKNITTENDEASTKIVNVSIKHLDKDSTNKKAVNDIVSTKISDSSDDHSSTDDDNMSDIEVEIKIKPKSKSRISKKISLKAPLSAVNTCFKNLNPLKKNPDFLNKLFQMNLKTPSENFRHGNTNKENETKNTSEKSSDVNQDITAEAVSNTQEVTYNSSHTGKDNAELSSSQQQEQSTQNNTILDKDKNETQSEGANIHVQSDQQTPVTGGNNSESSTSDKEKTADKQPKNPPKILLVDLDSGEMRELNQEASNTKRIKERGTVAVESTKSVPELQKQLLKTSSGTSDAKCSGGVRVQTSGEPGYMWSSNPINLSINSDASNGAHSMPSASSIYKPPPLYNSAANPAHHPPTTNAPAGVPTEIIPPNLDGNVTKSLSIVGQICFNFHICRKIIQEGTFSENKMYDFKICLYRIYEDIRTLKMMLRTTNNDDIMNYINQRKLLTIPVSINELAQYASILKIYLSFMGNSNVPPQLPTNNNSVQSAPITNAQASQPLFSGNIQGAPVPGVTSRTQPSAVRTKPSAVPQTGPNINQSQFSRSTINPSHSRLPSQSFCSQVPPTNIPVSNPATNSMINLQQQQPMRNANYVQGQHMSNMFAVNNNQQPFVNPSIGLHAPMAPPSASNTNNIRTNQRDINVSSARAKKYQPNVLPKSTTVAAPVTYMQQQMHQVPMFNVNSGTAHFLTMNQNANILQNVYYVNQPSVHTNINVPTNANVTGNLMRNTGLVNPTVNPQMQSPMTPAGKNVPQYNINVQTNFTSQSAHNQNILLIQNQQQQNFSHLNLPTSTPVHLIDTRNNVSQNAQPSMPNKRSAGIPETQTKDHVPNRMLFTKPQRDAHQHGAASVHNVSQEPFVQVLPKTSVSQKPSVSQNATSHTVLQTDRTTLISQTNPVAPSNKSVGPDFDVRSWTTHDQIRCRNQLHYYLKNCLYNSNSEKLRLENKMLIFFYTYLKNLPKLMKEDDVSEKASTVPNRHSVIRTSCSEIQSNNDSRSNENNLICDKVQERESLVESINPDASINSKSTAGADSAMKTQNVESSHLQSKSRSMTPNQIENSYPLIANLLQESTSHPLKMIRKINSSAFTVGEQSENIKISSAKSPNIPKESSNAETSRGISETKAQDDMTARHLAENSQLSKSFSLGVSQETSNLLQNMCAKITYVYHTTSNDDTKDKETGKSLSKDMNDKRLSKSSSSPAQNTLNLLQNDKTKDNVEGADNARTPNLCNISHVMILISSGGNEKAASQAPCNAEVRDKEVDNESSKTRENVQKNSEKSIFTDTPRASSTPFILDEASGLLIPTNRTSESIAQTPTFEPDFFTREDPTNEQINDSGKTHDDSFESLGRLHIDESAEKSEEEQDDRESSSRKDNTTQDSCLHETNRESAEMTLSSADDYGASLLKMGENSRKVKRNLSLKETAEKTPDVPEDISNTRASTSLEQSINTVEDTNENQAQMDTHSSVKAINELFKHVSDGNKHCAKPRTSPTKKSNVSKTKIYETAMLLDKNATSNVSPAESEDENSGVALNITNVSSIPSSLFEKMDNEVPQDLNYALIEMKEKNLLDENDNPEVTDSVLLNEMKEEQLSDNPEVPKSESLNEVIGEKSPDVNDTSKIFPVLLHEIQIKENPEIPFILNELEKEEQLDNPNVFVDINDKTEIFDSTPFEKVEIKESWFMDENSKDQHICKDKAEEEKPLDNPKVHDNVIWFTQEENQSSNVRAPEVPDSTLDDIDKKKLSNTNDGPEEPDEIEDRPCLRCEHKSTVYCQACLEATYCSKRCQRLHWISTHHKECNGRFSAKQPDQIICID